MDQEEGNSGSPENPPKKNWRERIPKLRSFGSRAGVPFAAVSRKVRAGVDRLKRRFSNRADIVEDGHPIPAPSEPIPEKPFPSRFSLANLRNLKLPAGFTSGAWAEKYGQALQKKGMAFYGKAVTILLCAYFLSDVLALMVGSLIPEAPPTLQRAAPHGRQDVATLNQLDPIISRNLFNSEGKIPGEDEGAPIADLGGPPVKTTLPLTLVGTVVLRDSARSVATIEDRSAREVFAVRQEDEIPNKARIVTVEPERVIFVNVQSGRREYVELPEDGARSRVTVGRAAPRGGGGAIEQTSATQFNVPRSEVDEALSNINQVLTQARAVPNFENGVPAGYKLFQIVPGSIYDKLGLKNGDVLCGLNGQAIDNPGKAFEMMTELKSSNHLELCVKRGGQTQTFSYDIN